MNFLGIWEQTLTITLNWPGSRASEVPCRRVETSITRLNRINPLIVFACYYFLQNSNSSWLLIIEGPRRHSKSLKFQQQTPWELVSNRLQGIPLTGVTAALPWFILNSLRLDTLLDQVYEYLEKKNVYESEESLLVWRIPPCFLES